MAVVQRDKSCLSFPLWVNPLVEHALMFEAPSWEQCEESTKTQHRVGLAWARRAGDWGGCDYFMNWNQDGKECSSDTWRVRFSAGVASTSQSWDRGSCASHERTYQAQHCLSLWTNFRLILWKNSCTNNTLCVFMCLLFSLHSIRRLWKLLPVLVMAQTLPSLTLSKLGSHIMYR